MIRRFLPDRIAAWIAISVLVALVVTQLVGFAIFFLMRPAPMPTFSADWLAGHVREASTIALSAPAAERPAILKDLNRGEWLRYEMVAEPPFSAQFPLPPSLETVRGRLAGLLHGTGSEVRVSFRPPAPPGSRGELRLPGLALPPPPPPRMNMSRIDVPPGPSPRGQDAVPDLPVPGMFRIAIAGADGAWLLVTSRDSHAFGHSPWLILGLNLAGILVSVVLVSIIAARRVIGPLRHLTAAARRVGLHRSVETVPERGPEELREIVRAFNEMQARLKAFVDDRTQMVAAMSHDMRTPLTRLRLRSEYIHDREQQRKMLEDLAEMEAIVETTLSYATQDAYRETQQPVDLAALVHGICDAANDAARIATYEGPNHLVCACQPLALRRALVNLVENACKHGGRAYVSLAEGEGTAIVTIRDAGPGIPESEFEKVFAPFYRLERSRNRGTGGTGLGLTLARGIVRAHGGHITLANGMPGLVVTVTLPKDGKALDPLPGEENEPRRASGGRAQG
jgi:signal transduction histidine kinase